LLLTAAIALCLVSVVLAGGRLGALADVRFRHSWAALAGLGVQIAIISVVPAGSPGLHAAVHVASYLLLGWFVFANRALPGLWLVALGGALNLTVIAANGGVMPATRGALEAAGRAEASDHFINSTTVANAHLQLLGDVFAVPASWPVVHNVFSVGDICLVVGAAMLLHGVCGSRLVRLRIVRR
jgi:Family of unknown function (DUF5317)